VRGLKTSARQGDNSNLATHEFDGDGRRAKISMSLGSMTYGYEQLTGMRFHGS